MQLSALKSNMNCDLSTMNNKRSIHRRCSLRKDVLRNSAKFTGKRLCHSLFFNRVAGLRPATLLKRFWRSCFPVNFSKFLRTPFLQYTSGRLLVNQIIKIKMLRLLNIILKLCRRNLLQKTI